MGSGEGRGVLMKEFKCHSGLVVPLDRVNVDTDAIIPKQFMKRIERTGYGEFLFHDWRYDQSGNLNDQFVLNFPQYQGASILLARHNFGCGSSREHAPWALEGYGIRVIIAPTFAEIFYTNCLKNGILPIVISTKEVNQLFKMIFNNEGMRLHVDLPNQIIRDGEQLSLQFQIEDEQKQRLLTGVDDIQITLQREGEITTFEEKRLPWLNPRKLGDGSLASFLS